MSRVVRKVLEMNNYADGDLTFTVIMIFCKFQISEFFDYIIQLPPLVNHQISSHQYSTICLVELEPFSFTKSIKYLQNGHIFTFLSKSHLKLTWWMINLSSFSCSCINSSNALPNSTILLILYMPNSPKQLL